MLCIPFAFAVKPRNKICLATIEIESVRSVESKLYSQAHTIELQAACNARRAVLPCPCMHIQSDSSIVPHTLARSVD